jgi:hypothetical protein
MMQLEQKHRAGANGRETTDGPDARKGRASFHAGFDEAVEQGGGLFHP